MSSAEINVVHMARITGTIALTLTNPISLEAGIRRDSMNKEKIKKRKTYELRLTKLELVHIRDLLSVVLPPDTKKTMSQILADLEDRVYIEEKLWDKVIDVCKEAGLPTGDEAPDYIVAPTAPPPMSVFHLSDDGSGEEDQEERGFLKNVEED